MALPVDCCGPDDAVPCCDQFFSEAHDLLATIEDAVRGCIRADCCDEIVFFVSHGEPMYIGSYVATWFAGVTSSPPDQFRSSRTLTVPPAVHEFRARLTLDIWQSFLPATRTTRYVMPDPAVHTRAARVVTGIGEKVYRRLLNSSRLFGDCEGVSVTDMIPLSPTGGQAGWDYTLQVYRTLR